MVTADHGPAVSGAHNTIVSARAGKDLVSSLASGLLTIVSMNISCLLSLSIYLISIYIPLHRVIGLEVRWMEPLDSSHRHMIPECFPWSL